MGCRDGFAAFILTHGRARNVQTYGTLRKCGYTGPIYVVIDDEDGQADEYRRIYGGEVVQFCKAEVARGIDAFDNFPERRAIIYARHWCFALARKLGLTHFVELDDDYSTFMHRFTEDGRRLLSRRTRRLDDVFAAYLDFLDETGALAVAFVQGGDLLGGCKAYPWPDGCIRKAMNAFFCRTDRPFSFRGKINEDVCTYTMLGSVGGLFLSPVHFQLLQGGTQQNTGGMTGLYLDVGTYVKTFYSVIGMPSAVKVSVMGKSNLRMHHSIAWRNCVPKILNEKWRRVK